MGYRYMHCLDLRHRTRDFPFEKQEQKTSCTLVLISTTDGAASVRNLTSLLHGSLREGGHQQTPFRQLKCETHVKWNTLMGNHWQSPCFFIWEHGTCYNSFPHNHELIVLGLAG